MPFKRFGRKRLWESLVHGNSEFQANNFARFSIEKKLFFISSCSYFISQPASQQYKFGSPSPFLILIFVFNFWFPSFCSKPVVLCQYNLIKSLQFSYTADVGSLNMPEGTSIVYLSTLVFRSGHIRLKYLNLKILRSPFVSTWESVLGPSLNLSGALTRTFRAKTLIWILILGFILFHESLSTDESEDESIIWQDLALLCFQ